MMYLCSLFVVDKAHVERELPIRPVKPPNVQNIPRRMPPVRKWHPPTAASSPSTSDEDSDPSVIFAPHSMSRKGKEKETILPNEIPHEVSVSREVSTSSDDSSLESDDSSSTDSETTVPVKKLVLPQKRKQTSSPPHETKKKRFGVFVPTTKEAIEELRQIGKFIKGWTHKDAEVCCVCFEDVTTPTNPLVYCDNALCEVIVHKNCYRIRNNIANVDHWYCDRCRPVDGVSVYQNVVMNFFFFV